MKKSLLLRFIILLVTIITLSGCIVEPWGWDDRGHHGGGYYGEGHHSRGDYSGDGRYAYNRGDRH